MGINTPYHVKKMMGQNFDLGPRFGPYIENRTSPSVFKLGMPNHWYVLTITLPKY